MTNSKIFYAFLFLLLLPCASFAKTTLLECATEDKAHALSIDYDTSDYQIVFNYNKKQYRPESFTVPFVSYVAAIHGFASGYIDKNYTRVELDMRDKKSGKALKVDIKEVDKSIDSVNFYISGLPVAKFFNQDCKGELMTTSLDVYSTKAEADKKEQSKEQEKVIIVEPVIVE